MRTPIHLYDQLQETEHGQKKLQARSFLPNLRGMVKDNKVGPLRSLKHCKRDTTVAAGQSHINIAAEQLFYSPLLSTGHLHPSRLKPSLRRFRPDHHLHLETVILGLFTSTPACLPASAPPPPRSRFIEPLTQSEVTIETGN